MLAKRDKISIITSIISGITTFVMSAVCVSLIMELNSVDAFGEAEKIIGDASEHDLTGGYEVIGGLGMFFGGIIIEMMIYIIAIAGIGILVAGLICVISGIVSHIRYKKSASCTFVLDSVLKIIFGMVPVIVTLALLTSNNAIFAVLAVIPASVPVLSIVSLFINDKKTEEIVQ